MPLHLLPCCSVLCVGGGVGLGGSWCGSVALPEKWICSDGQHQWHCTGLSLLLNHSFKLILWAQRSRCALRPSSGPGSSNGPTGACMPITPTNLPRRAGKARNKEVFAHLLREANTLLQRPCYSRPIGSRDCSAVWRPTDDLWVNFIVLIVVFLFLKFDSVSVLIKAAISARSTTALTSRHLLVFYKQCVGFRSVFKLSSSPHSLPCTCIAVRNLKECQLEV